MSKMNLKLVKKERTNMYIRAMIINQKRNISARNKRAYCSLEKAILGSMAWIMRDGQVGSLITIYDNDSSQEMAQIRMTSLGNIRTVFPWRMK